MKSLFFLAIFVVSAVLLTSCSGGNSGNGGDSGNSGNGGDSGNAKLSVETGEGAEGGETMNVTFTVSLSNASADDVTFKYRIDISNDTSNGTSNDTNNDTNNDTAEAADFASTVQLGTDIVAMIEAGDLTLEIPVEIDDDDLVEGSETFSLILSEVSGADFDPAGKTITAIGTIADNDRSLLSVGASIGSEETRETTFNVSLSRPSPGDITFRYSTSISSGTDAAQQADFTEISEVEGMIKAGENTLDIVVEIVNDNLVEGNEIFSLMLSDISGARAVFDPSGAELTVIGTIIDNDGVVVDLDGDSLIDIATVEQLNNIRHNGTGTSYKISGSDAGSSVGCPVGVCTGYELLNDVDLSLGNISDWVPIPTFSAIFDGRGYTISNISITVAGEGRAGFFGEVSGMVKNLKLRGGSVARTGAGSDSSSSGAVAGELSGGIIDKVSSDLTVNGRGKMGGLVGEVGGGTVQNSYATGAVAGGAEDDSVGGLVGSFGGGTVRNSYATGAVAGGAKDDRVGGLVGFGYGGYYGAKDATIRSSYATGTVKGEGGNDNVGGLVGFAAGTVTILKNYALGNVYGGDDTDKAGRVSGKRNEGTFFGNYVLSSSDLEGEDPRCKPNCGVDEFKEITTDEFKALVVGTTGTDFTSSDTTDGWSDKDWNFTTDKYPSLKSYKTNASNAQVEGELLCSQGADWVQC